MTDPENTGGTTPDPASPATGKRKFPWAAFATLLTAAAAALSILMFLTDSESLGDLLSRADSTAAEPSRSETPVQEALSDTGGAIETARGDDASNGAPDRATVTPPVRTQGVDEGDRTYPIDVRVEGLRVESGQSLVTLALTNRSQDPLRYLYAVRSSVRSQNATDRYDLLTTDGSVRTPQGHRGLLPTRDGAHEVFCLALPPEATARMSLVFQEEAAGPATLVHTGDPDLIRYRTCEGTTIALRDFRIDIPQTR